MAGYKVSEMWPEGFSFLPFNFTVKRDDLMREFDEWIHWLFLLEISKRLQEEVELIIYVLREVASSRVASCETPRSVKCK